MAAHRYWRLRATALLGAGGKAGIAEMEMREAPGGANLPIVYGGTIMSNGYVGYSYDTYVFDSGTGNYWISAYGVGDWVGWDFGVGVAYDVREIKITNANNTDYTIGAGVFEWSDDGSSWTSYITITGRGNTAGATTTHAYLVPGNVTVDLTAPTSPFSIYGGASASTTSPAPTLKVYSGLRASLTAPTPTLYVSGHDSSGENALDVTAPSSSLVAYGGANSALRLPTPTTSLTATITGLARAALHSPSPTVAATGTVSGLGRSSPYLGMPMATLVGYGGAVVSATTAVGTVASTGATGGVGSVNATLPLFELTASTTAQSYGSAALISPALTAIAASRAYLIAPGYELTAIGTAVVAVTYEAYALNLNHSAEGPDELTRYTNYPFTHIVRYKNSYFGMSSAGLYLLAGTTDDGTAIDYEVITHKTDFDVPELKTVPSAYFGGRLGAAETVSIIAGETAANTYAYTTPRGALAQNYRQEFGRGIKARYYAFGLSGSAEFALDTLDVEPLKLKRRI